MNDFLTMMQLLFIDIKEWIVCFLGGDDGLIRALLLFVVMDYVTGSICAIFDKNFSLKVGFKEIWKKVIVFILVGVANVLDKQIFSGILIMRTAVIFFYLSNEGTSLLGNAQHLGLPVPEKLKKILEQLHKRSQDDSDNKRNCG